jgi:hypothetical protein
MELTFFIAHLAEFYLASPEGLSAKQSYKLRNKKESHLKVWTELDRYLVLARYLTRD